MLSKKYTSLEKLTRRHEEKQKIWREREKHKNVLNKG